MSKLFRVVWFLFAVSVFFAGDFLGGHTTNIKARITAISAHTQQEAVEYCAKEICHTILREEPQNFSITAVYRNETWNLTFPATADYTSPYTIGETIQVVERIGWITEIEYGR